MAELEFLKEYSGQTTDELLALEGKYRTDSLVLAFEEALYQKSGRVGGGGVTEEENVILAVEALEREVNNGGYVQLFFNSSKMYVPILVVALNRIGRSDVAALTQEAIDALGIEGPVTVESIDRVLDDDSDERDEKLRACDTRYFEFEGCLADPLFEFIKQNRDRIKLTNG